MEKRRNGLFTMLMQPYTLSAIISYLDRYFIKVAKSPLKWKPTTVVVEKTVNLSLNFLAESHSISFIFTHLTLIISS